MENQNFPKRKPTRLTEFDYSTPGAYFVTICTHEKAKILSRIEKIQRSQQLIPRIIGYMKMNSSKAIHAIDPKLNIWQRSFHDHIIRTEKEHLKIYEYVENNPFTWENDCFY